MAKDSAFIPTLKDGDFPLRPSRSYKLNLLLLSFLYLKAYREALQDFEVAVKDSSYVDLALKSVQRKYIEKIERIERELS